MSSSLSLGILLVIFIQTRIEKDRRNEISDNFVLVRLVGLIVDIILSERAEILADYDG